MIHRSINLSKTHSFFLFGARGSGKSTLIQERYGSQSFLIDLLLAETENRYQRNPDLLISDLKSLAEKPQWVVIDEIQKVPKLLDLVHHLIEKEKYRFILTGSSARKLRRASANLLAGRTFMYNLFPLTLRELGSTFDLDTVLNYGSLPHLLELDHEDKTEFLRAYSQSYLKEEILQEQIVRNGSAFRDFLEIAAQENGKCLNFTKIGRDLGVDTKTVQSYFEILEDTLVGFRLLAFHRSVRKSQKHQPKFYIFDLGIKKAMERSLDSKLVPRTSAYGNAFEHLVILETFRLNEYARTDYRFSHYQSSQSGEIDLVLTKGRQTFAIEIKSSAHIDEVEVRHMSRISEALQPTRKFFISLDPTPSKIEDVECLPMSHFFNELF
jgi:uncharacterized protein